jgi:hypothetical protein
MRVTHIDVPLVSVAKPAADKGYLLRELDDSKGNSHFVARRWVTRANNDLSASSKRGFLYPPTSAAILRY